MSYLSFTNSKLKKDGIYTFGIPAGRSRATGVVTCPNAGACAVGCYAKQGFYVMPNVLAKQEERLKLFLDTPGLFVLTICEEIRARGVKRLRIHDSGDFFSVSYLEAWLEIIRRNPGVRFYAYTKMVRLFKTRFKELPPNFHVIFSEGGTQDYLIDVDADQHSRVFPSVSMLRRNRYSNAATSDRPSLMGKQRIGLVYHGAPSRAWGTA